ncbi:hypothetical protein Pse7367_1530 [Thalassoporum mexicanum PCC 7367]|uniref:hypothetical protein n=1 Tax=Thalassoporum mexicanum TaxID=3457544 RepID=UPI00029FCE65|nr:hypothetical protein [Pseudanabaena sp. PCC 7367]AFY69819.1 hypothetical protein Pse7367_1530 [Pseudanabaena sp. PCC 7367]
MTDNINPEVPEQPDSEKSILDDLNDIFLDEDDDRQDDQVDSAFDALFDEDKPSPEAEQPPQDQNQTEDDDFDAILEASSEAEIDSAFDALFAQEEQQEQQEEDNPAGGETVPDAELSSDSELDDSFSTEMSELDAAIVADPTDPGDSESAFEDVFGEAEDNDTGDVEESSPAALDPFAPDQEDQDEGLEDDFAALFADEIEEEVDQLAATDLEMAGAIEPESGEAVAEELSSENMDDAFESILAKAEQENDPVADTEADFSFRSGETEAEQPESDLGSDLDLADEESSINDAFESILADTNPGIDTSELSELAELSELSELTEDSEETDEFGIELDESVNDVATNLQLDYAAAGDSAGNEADPTTEEPEFEVDALSPWDSEDDEAGIDEADFDAGFGAMFDATTDVESDPGEAEFVSEPPGDVPDPFAFDADEPFASESEGQFPFELGNEDEENELEPIAAIDDLDALEDVAAEPGLGSDDPFAEVETDPAADEPEQIEMAALDELADAESADPFDLDQPDLAEAIAPEPDDELAETTDLEQFDQIDEFGRSAETEEVDLDSPFADEADQMEQAAAFDRFADAEAEPLEDFEQPEEQFELASEIEAELDEFDPLVEELEEEQELAASATEPEIVEFEEVDEIAEIEETAEFEQSIEPEPDDRSGIDLGTVGTIGVGALGIAGVASQAMDSFNQEDQSPAIEPAAVQGLSGRVTDLEEQFQSWANRLEDSLAEIEEKSELVSQLATQTEQRYGDMVALQSELSNLHQGVQAVANEIGGLEALSNLYQEHQSVLTAITNFQQNAEYLQQLQEETAQSETRIDSRLHQTQQRLNEINDVIANAQAELLQQAISISADIRRSPASQANTQRSESAEPAYNFEDESPADMEIAFTPEPQAAPAPATAGVSLEQLSTQLAGMTAQIRSEKDALQREMKQKLKSMIQTQSQHRTWLLGLSVGVVLALAGAIVTFILK